MRKNITIAFAALALSGCATIMDGTKQTVAVSSSPAQGAQCTLTNAVGAWDVVTPGYAVVRKSNSDLAIRCTMAGYADARQSFAPTFNPAGNGNILLGGIIGGAIDASTGASNQYPNAIVVKMESR